MVIHVSMKVNTDSLKGFIWCAIFMMAFTTCFSQKPVIHAADKNHGTSGELVTLQGTFNSDITKVSVLFGGSQGNVQFVSDQLLEVRVPARAVAAGERAVVRERGVP